MEMRECANRLRDLLSRANESLTDYDRKTLEAAIELLHLWACHCYKVQAEFPRRRKGHRSDGSGQRR